MGFIDHSSSNIIIDAVLTDVGRQFLAKNDGSFKIAYFSLADDEVDYTTIKKFGRVIGKEKIEKNTPIFEAQTNAGLALKYKCVTANNPDLTFLPKLKIISIVPNSSYSGQTVEFYVGPTNRKSANLTFAQEFDSVESVDGSLIDDVFTVKVPNSFLSVTGYIPQTVDKNGMAHYSISSTVSDGGTMGGKLEFALNTKTISTAQFNTYGVLTAGSSGTTTKTIQLACSVTGASSGCVKTFVVNITNS